MIETNFSFIRGSEAAKKLTPEWMDAFDNIMPQWLKLLVPAYNTCKKRNVSFFQVSNVIDEWSKPAKIEEDGFSYLLWDKPEEVSRMSFDGNGSSWGTWEWRSLLEFRYPHLYEEYNPEYVRVGTELSDFATYHYYFSRYMNCREPYNFIADRVDEYFKELTGDPDVYFSLGGTCYFALDAKGRKYGNHFSHYYWG